jgi:DNA-directed RNA polymerase specialized sigma24 family protein
MDPSPVVADELPAPIVVLLENHRAFLRYLERRVGDRALAEDILQDEPCTVLRYEHARGGTAPRAGADWTGGDEGVL